MVTKKLEASYYRGKQYTAARMLLKGFSLKNRNLKEESVNTGTNASNSRTKGVKYLSCSSGLLALLKLIVSEGQKLKRRLNYIFSIMER